MTEEQTAKVLGEAAYQIQLLRDENTRLRELLKKERTDKYDKTSCCICGANAFVKEGEYRVCKSTDCLEKAKTIINPILDGKSR